MLQPQATTRAGASHEPGRGIFGAKFFKGVRMKNSQKAFQALIDAGATVSIDIPYPQGGGSQSLTLDAADMALLCKDPVSFRAAACGVTRAQYLAWTADRFSVRCSAITVAGKRCRCTVSGGGDVSAQRWVEMQGMYCAIHEWRGG